MGLKEKLNSFPRFDPDRLKEKIKAHRIISFDIFDTLLKRDVAGERDVFDLAERLYNRRHHADLSGFRIAREEAERYAREQAGDREITIREIYRVLAETKHGAWGEETVRELMAMELEAEKMASCPNLQMKPVYQYCLDAGKEIVLVSDMYLDQEFLRELLEKNGYNGYRALYVSSSIGRRKRDGSLFQYVLEAESCRPQEMLNIGDSKGADFLAPRRLGIHTAPVARDMRQTRYITKGQTIESGCVYAFINNRMASFENRQGAIGYEVYGPLLYGFTKWLCGRLDPRKTILFFARDCYVVLPAYRMLSGDAHAGVYFEGSRKSLVCPALWMDSSLEQAVRLLRSEPRRITFEGLLRKFNLDPDKYGKVAQKHGISAETVLDRDKLFQNEAFASFWNEVSSLVKEDSAQAYQNFQAYFSSLNCTDEIQVVDIGWRGTMQYCLKQLLPDRYRLKGYYLGVREDAFLDEDEREGYFLSGENDEEKKCFLASVSALIEIFFSAPHGTVKGYSQDGEPVHEEYECKDDKPSRELVEHLHDGAMKFINDFSERGMSELLEVDAELGFAGLRDMGGRPGREEMDSFGEYPFQMGVGIVKAASPGSLMNYLIHPKRLLFDFANSNWKVAFMKRLLGMPLPYYKIFRLIYQHK